MTELYEILSQFDDDITAIEQRPIYKNRILFYGSSTFTYWNDESMERQISAIGGEVPITLNHGFGGSTAEQALYYYHRMVRPYSPRIMVFYEGDNDFTIGYTPEESFSIAVRLYEWFLKDFPESKLFIVGVKYSPARIDIIDKHCAYNKMNYDYAQSRERVHFIDIKSMLYDSDGRARTDIYVEDMLHFNEKGYEDLSAIIQSEIIKQT